MNIAIIGAGVAGLACAHELEKYNIRATIYEKNSYIGEPISHVSALLELVDRPIVDCLRYIKNEFNIEITPLNTINKIITCSPNKMYEAKGNLGYFIKRGKDADDLKNQLHAQLNNTDIRLGEKVDYQTLSKQYDFVVIANGTPSISKELGCFRELFNGYVRGSVVSGEFDPNTLIAWFDKNYCKDGYAYLTPYNSQKAFIGLVISDINESETEFYWQLFKKAENIDYPVIEKFRINHVAGFVYPNTVKNMLLAGNAGGALSSFLGFGQFNSIIMGVMAARSMVYGVDYGSLLGNIKNKNKQKHQLRKAINKVKNKDYDKAAALIGLPGIKQLIYNTRLDVIKYGADSVEFMNRGK